MPIVPLLGVTHHWPGLGMPIEFRCVYLIYCKFTLQFDLIDAVSPESLVTLFPRSRWPQALGYCVWQLSCDNACATLFRSVLHAAHRSKTVNTFDSMWLDYGPYVFLRVLTVLIRWLRGTAGGGGGGGRAAVHAPSTAHGVCSGGGGCAPPPAAPDRTHITAEAPVAGGGAAEDALAGAAFSPSWQSSTTWGVAGHVAAATGGVGAGAACTVGAGASIAVSGGAVGGGSTTARTRPRLRRGAAGGGGGGAAGGGSVPSDTRRVAAGETATARFARPSPTVVSDSCSRSRSSCTVSVIRQDRCPPARTNRGGGGARVACVRACVVAARWDMAGRRTPQETMPNQGK